MIDDQRQPPPADGPGGNAPVMSVSDLSRSLKRTVEDAYAYVRVRGEISRPSLPKSGHLYLTLKDADSVLQAVCWRGTVSRLTIRPEEGLEVICTGRLTTYPGRSTYQLVIERMEAAGEGALLKMIEERRRRLAAEGLFADERKRPVPQLPARIGVITSPTGAVIRDILHRVGERFPRHVLVWPVAVQGDAAVAQIIAALEGFGALQRRRDPLAPDVLIVARGGGSIEDLWAFNDEDLVRAVAASPIPVISAVGHETDTTLIDFASDLRAPTPTAAAERAVPVRSDLLADVGAMAARLERALGRALERREADLRGLTRALGDPKRLLEGPAQRLDDWGERLRGAPVRAVDERARWLAMLSARFDAVSLVRPIDQGGERVRALSDRARRAMDRRLERYEQAVVRAGQLLESLSYRRVLERGYAVARDVDGHAIIDAASAAETLAKVEFADGSVAVRAGGRKPATGGKGKPPAQPQLL